MHRPQVDGPRLAPRVISSSEFLEGAANFPGNLAGEMHVEAELADAPGDEVVCAGNLDGEEAVDGEPVRLSADQARRAAIREDEEREHLLQLVSLLKVQRAEFEVEDEDLALQARSEQCDAPT